MGEIDRPAKRHDDLCPVHDEMQRRLDDRWRTHVAVMESNFREMKDDLAEIFNRLRLVEIRIWMALGGLAAMLALAEIVSKVFRVIHG